MLSQCFVIKICQVAQFSLVSNRCSSYWAHLGLDSLWLRSWCWSFMGLAGWEDMEHGTWLDVTVGNCNLRHSSVREEATSLLRVYGLHMLALTRMPQAVFYFWSFPKLVRKSLTLGLYLVTVNAWNLTFDVWKPDTGTFSGFMFCFKFLLFQWWPWKTIIL